MDLPELQRRLDRLVRLDLSPHYDAYRAKSGGGDVDGFLEYLAAAGTLDPAVLKELNGMTEVETPSVLDPAYQGTKLAAWATTLAGVGAREASEPGARAPQPSLATVSTETPVPTDLRFRPIARLGEGAMGAVDIARDVYLRRRIALKTVLPSIAGNPAIFSRFLSEMQITAQLEHPNIVPVYALDVSPGGSLGYAMKLVQGKDLAQILSEASAKVEKGEPLDDEHALDKRLEIFIKVCDAVEFAHSKGIVHRDLKPENVMIGRHHEVYVMDWGIARPIGATERNDDVSIAQGDPSGANLGRTRLGDTVGTPPYMSPEQAQGRNAELDGKSDQYALGLILQECVTLRPAVDGATLQAVLIKAMMAKREPAPIGSGPGAMPREIDAIVRRATRLDPKDRYPSVRALADEVRRYLRGEAVEALPEGRVRRASRWFARHRMATLTLLFAIVVVGAGGTIGALVAGQARIDAEHARELRVSQMAAESAIQTQLVDRDLTRYEAALEELVGAVQLALSTTPTGEGATYFEPSFGAKETAPPDYGPSRRYGRDVSVIAPLASLAPGVARASIEPLLRPLALLGPSFRALLLSSSRTDWRALSLPAQRALITDAGVPAFRAALALAEGVTLSFPGMAAKPPVDAREEAYYKLAASKAGVVWGAPTMVDGDSILPASAAIHDERGAFRGVALLEVSLNRLLERPETTALDFVQSRALVARDGNVMAEDAKAGGSAPLPPEVKAAIAAGKSGSMVAEVNGRRYQYAFHPLSSVDWYYVASGELDRMIESKQKVATSDLRKVIASPTLGAPQKPVMASPPPRATATAAPAASGADVPDAGATDDAAAVDAGARRIGVSLPKASATAASGTAAPADLPPNPFEPWKQYVGQKKKP